MAKDNFFNWVFAGRTNMSGIEKNLYVDHKYNVYKSICTSSSSVSGKFLAGRTDINYWHKDFMFTKKKTEIELFNLLEIRKLYIREIGKVPIDHRKLFKINKIQ